MFIFYMMDNQLLIEGHHSNIFARFHSVMQRCTKLIPFPVASLLQFSPVSLSVKRL